MIDPIKFTIPDKEFKRLQKTYSNRGKNSHIGKYGVEVVNLYLKSIGASDTQLEPIKGADIKANFNKKSVMYEVKATTDKKIAFNKLKVSSRHCYELLKKGMKIIRVCEIGKQEINLYFLEEGKDFELIKEDRWSVKKLK